MANRYSDLTPSAYTPLTLEEIAMVPAMKRKQHDAVLAQQEAIRSGLTKVDPLDVHFDKALELKKGLEGKMDATAAELAANGINPDMIGKTLALNREVQDLISPMGDIGRINASKVEYNKQMADFLKSAEDQKIGSARALDLWKEKTKGYTGYDPQGKISNVTPQGVAAYQDYSQDLSRYHSILGKTTKGTTSSGHHLEQDGKGNFWEVTRNGERVKTDNTKQLEAAYRGMYDKWIAPGGEGTAYAKDAGLGIDERRLANDFASMTEKSDISKSTESANYNQYDPTKDPNYKPAGEGPTMITDPISLKETITDSALNDISNLGNRNYKGNTIPPKNRYESESDYRKRVDKLNATGHTVKNIFGLEHLPKELRAQVEDIYNAKKAQGKISKNDKLTDYKKETIKVITDELKRLQNLNFSNQVIVPDSAGNSILASPQLAGKDVTTRNLFIQNRLYNALNEDKKKQGNMIFDSNGKAVDLDEVDIESVKLVGHYSPANKLPKFGGNDDNAVSPHKVTWKDKDGNQHTGLMPRDASEMTSNEFRGARVIKRTVDKAVDREGNFTSFNYKDTPELLDADLSTLGYKGRGLHGIRVKYNNDAKTYTLELIDQNGNTVKTNAQGQRLEMDEKTYQDVIYDMID